MTKYLMIQGTHSSAGKSVIAAAFCRIFSQDGLKVAPFKAQNMSLNAGVTTEGGEMGRAQIVQAEAAGIAPHTDMNPILLKPEGNAQSQIILNGKIFSTLNADNYYAVKSLLWTHVTEAIKRLSQKYELIIIEGAGSPVEINLKEGDIVNMQVAKHLNAPVLLVGDIDRGGVFASLVGTMVLLEPEERELVKGFLINKFRGDPILLGNGLQMLKDKAYGVPALGVIPFLTNLGIADEDSATLDQTSNKSSANNFDQIEINIIQFPKLSNYDEFDALAKETGVLVRFVQSAKEIGNPHAVILPGSKTTSNDLDWLRKSGIAEKVVIYARKGGTVVGICGGFQMMGESIHNPLGLENIEEGITDGMGLLPVETIFEEEKITQQTEAEITTDYGPFKSIQGQKLKGYQIHNGRSKITGKAQPLLNIFDKSDGAIAHDGKIWGCYLHGIFENDNLRHAWLKGLGWQHAGITFERETAFNRLADTVRSNIDMKMLYEIIR